MTYACRQWNLCNLARLIASVLHRNARRSDPFWDANERSARNASNAQDKRSARSAKAPR